MILCTTGMCECAGIMHLITNKLQRHGKQLVRGCIYRDIILSNTMQHSMLIMLHVITGSALITAVTICCEVESPYFK